MIKILIVDDEPAFTNTYVMFLKRIKDVETYGAMNSKEAFEQLRSRSPEILFLDLNLNEAVKGLDILKSALEQNPKLHAIVTTGNMDARVEEQCLAAGAKSVIHKPVSLQELQDHMSGVVEKIRTSKAEGSS